MAKQRSISTKFWSDSYIIELSAREKFFFLYLLTNDHTKLSGVYELPVKVMAFESGIEQQHIEAMLEKFAQEGKVYFFDGWVFIRNFIKNLKINPSVKKGIERELSEVPEKVFTSLRQTDDSMYTDWVQAVYSLGIALEQPGNSLCTDCDILEPKLKPKLKPNGERVARATSPSPGKEAREFFDSQEKQEAMAQRLIADGCDEALVREEMPKFVAYWTEPTKSGRKVLWETKPTFEVRRRLATWLNQPFRTNNSPPFGQGPAMIQ
jgi:hypothetical protein